MEKRKSLTRYEQQSRERIIQLINEYCDGSQHNFAERTGLNKGSVSQYVNGKNTPSNLNAQKIADTFNVSVMWVMGFDVDRENLASYTFIQHPTQLEKHIFKNFQDTHYADDYLEIEMLDLLRQMPELKELIIYYNNMSADNKLKIIDFALRIKNGEKPIVCTDKKEREVITAFRNTNEHLQGAVCNILGVKGDTVSETENLSEGSSNIG